MRLASSGKECHRNTHPFSRELNGNEYVFAHNGTLPDIEDWLKLGKRFRPTGKTDSEYVFCHLLNCIVEKGIARWTTENTEHFDWLAAKFREINDYGDGTLNCIFSDGEFLFCYHDKDGDNGLCFIHRKPPYGKIRLLDEDWDINLTQEKDPAQTGFIIATRILTDEPWEDFKGGELFVCKDGKLVYSNCRNILEQNKPRTL